MEIVAAKNFIKQLKVEDCMYHFDDDAVDCLYEPNKITTLERAQEIQRTIDNIYASNLNWGKYDCPIGYALYVMSF
tara:strand:+ start:153 stop:380 length:228 start_codon:yes stop_codon:yes gene_type:complete